MKNKDGTSMKKKVIQVFNIHITQMTTVPHCVFHERSIRTVSHEQTCHRLYSIMHFGIDRLAVIDEYKLWQNGKIHGMYGTLHSA